MTTAPHASPEGSTRTLLVRFAGDIAIALRRRDGLRLLRIAREHLFDDHFFGHVLGLSLVVVLAYTLINFLVDLSYAYLDPRIRLD